MIQKTVDPIKLVLFRGNATKSTEWILRYEGCLLPAQWPERGTANSCFKVEPMRLKMKAEGTQYPVGGTRANQKRDSKGVTIP